VLEKIKEIILLETSPKIVYMEELDFYQLSREKLIEILRSKLKIVAEKTEKGFKFSFVGKDEAKIYARQVSPRVEKFI
jgi:hypothetical protein